MTAPVPEKPVPEKPVPELLSELWGLIRTYLRQETLDPIRDVGRFVAFGALGALLLGIGVVFLAVGALRALQGETDAFDGNLSWAPYAIVFAGLVLGGVASLAAITRRGARQGTEERA